MLFRQMQIISTITLHLITTKLSPLHVPSLMQCAIIEGFREVNTEQSFKGRYLPLSSMSCEKPDPFQQKPVDD